MKEIKRIMFTGDSVTDCNRARPVGDGAGQVGDSYVANLFTWVWARNPENNLRFLNTATSGDTSRRLLSRFDDEVLAFKPDHLFIMIGINDCWRYFDDCSVKPEIHIPPEESAANVEEMIKKTLDIGAVPVIISPIFFDLNKNDPMRAKCDELNRLFKETAKKYSVDFIDVQSVADKYLEKASSYILTGDRVHPKAVGKALIADTVYASDAFQKLLK